MYYICKFFFFFFFSDSSVEEEQVKEFPVKRKKHQRIEILKEMPKRDDMTPPGVF